METIAFLGSAVGLGLTSGIRLYATVLAIGLSIRFGLFHPYPGLQHLAVLASPYVLVPAGIAFLMEFLADKIAWVDSVWDLFHTFIRPVGAAMLGAAVIGDVEPRTKIAIMLLCGGVAFTSHSVKAGTRLLVNHSPEPLSNIGVSLVEDGLAAFGAWLAIRHPLAALGLAAAFLALFAWLAPKVFRKVRNALRAVAAWFRPAATSGIAPPA